MQRINNALSSAHTILLATAFGILITTGVAAAVAFATTAELDIAVQQYSKLTDPHNRLVPGLIMNTIFRVSDTLVIGCILLASACLITLTTRLKRNALNPTSVLQLVTNAMLLALTIYHTLIFRPALNEHLDAYHQLAQQGDINAAAPHKQAFDEDHPRATFLLMTQTGFVFVAITLAAVRQTLAPSASIATDRQSEGASQ